MIIVLATIELHPGKRSDFLAEFRKIIPKVRAENGCHEYFPAIDTVSGLPVQGPARDDIVVVVENTGNPEDRSEFTLWSAMFHATGEP